jgi:4-oxalocrotonate tautomerase family enzyme
MPLIQIDLMEGVPEGKITELVERVPARYAELIESPIQRIRAVVNEFPASHWRVGGQAEVEPYPLIRVELMRGRPRELLTEIMADLSNMVAEILGIPVSRTRFLIREMEPEHWGIGGVPAAEVRADEVAARAAAT